MGFDVKNIFSPSVGVDLVFNMNSITPVSKSSIIYDTNHDKNTIILAQPRIPITKDTSFDQLHLTTIIHTDQKKIRVGIPCQPIQYINQYRLANNAATKALVIQYQLPAAETNIRSAFRLPLSTMHDVKAKLRCDKQEFYTSRDFKIKDISFAGMGLVVLKKTDNTLASPLLNLKPGTTLTFGVALVDKEKKDPMAAFPVKTRVVRVNQHYSKSHTLIGLEIISITKEGETLLNQFIHNAQVDELKRLSKRG